MQIVASVAGLAPARTSLKGWLRELLCIHGLFAQDQWSPRLVSRQRLLGFNEALICLSYSGVLADCHDLRTAIIFWSALGGIGSLGRCSTSKGWSFRVVTLHVLSLIGRVLCF